MPVEQQRSEQAGMGAGYAGAAPAPVSVASPSSASSTAQTSPASSEAAPPAFAGGDAKAASPDERETLVMDARELAAELAAKTTPAARAASASDATVKRAVARASAQPVPSLDDAMKLPVDQTDLASPAAVPTPYLSWRSAPSWGPTTLTFSSNTAAGISYLFWWISGLVVYFNERENRFVRFHAVQSILLTSGLTILGVLALMTAELMSDISQMSGIPIYATLGRWEAVLVWLAIAALWLGAMIAAWSGAYLRLPYIAHFAERYALPAEVSEAVPGAAFPLEQPRN